MPSKSKHLIAISYAKRTLQPGSRERARMQSYAAELDSYHIIVFTRQTDNTPAVQHDGNLHLYATNARTKIGMLWAAYRLGRRILKQNQEEQFVVTSQDPFESSLVGRALARARNATHHVQIHGDVFNPLSYRTSLLQRLRARYGRYVVRRAPAIRVVSERIKTSLLILGVTPDRVTVVPVQADLASLLPLGTTRTHTPQSPLRLLFLGRLAPEKQLPLLLQAVEQLNKEGVDVTLHIVGSGPTESALRHQVFTADLTRHVTFTPWTDDIASIMHTADVFCLPSAHEGWAMVLLEAAAAGLAIVSTDVGCVGECLVPEESLLVANTSEQFAVAIKRLYDPALRTKLAQNAHQTATAYTTDATTYPARVIAGHFTEH